MAKIKINPLDDRVVIEQHAAEERSAGGIFLPDNAKEKPYNNIYPRITTKSNTFKVHYRAQILTKAKVTAPDEFDPEIDQVVAEYRGSSIVERYVEPNDPDIPDYASASATSGSSGSTVASLDKFYKFRVVNPTRFAP